MGSGKDTVADYLQEKHGANLYRFSDLLREALEVFLEPEKIGREDLIWISNNIRGRYGNSILADGLRKKFNEIQEGIIVLNGMRIREDLDFLRGFPSSKVIYVTIPQKTRWERVFGRGEKSDDAVSFEKFQEMEKAETEVQIPEIGKNADFTLTNNENKDSLRKKTESIIKKIENE